MTTTRTNARRRNSTRQGTRALPASAARGGPAGNAGTRIVAIEAASRQTAPSPITAESPWIPATCPASSVPRTNAAEPAPRTHPYSNPPDLPSCARRAWASDNASASGTSGARAAAWNRLTTTTIQNGTDREIRQRDHRRENGENGKLGTKSVEAVSKAPGERIEDKPHRGSRAQHRRDVRAEDRGRPGTPAGTARPARTH